MITRTVETLDDVVALVDELLDDELTYVYEHLKPKSQDSVKLLGLVALLEDLKHP